MLIENLHAQLALSEERADMLVQMNQELTNQLDAFTNKEVTQKYVQTDRWVYRVKQVDQCC